ncbi:hypothetical protein PWT90_04920 [Aphanocladium album]|nr:hypothetical protein PWT90_04920 [Aphanocladium album]
MHVGSQVTTGWPNSAVYETFCTPDTTRILSRKPELVIPSEFVQNIHGMQTTAVASDRLGTEAIHATHITKRDIPYPTANLGLLTSDFSPPSSCASLTLGYFGHLKGATEIVTFDYGHACDPLDARHLDPSCYPPRYAAAFDNLNEAVETSNIIFPVFSPASKCPSGYVSACGFGGPTSTFPEHAQHKNLVHRQLAVGQTSNNFNTLMTQLLATTQTAIGCCPSGYSCYADRAYHCVSEASVGAVVTADANTFCKSHTANMRKYTAASSDSMYADAPCLVLVQDLSTTQSTTSAASSTPNYTSTNETSSNSKDTEGGGLSTGAKAAIGVCIPLFAIFAALGLFVCYRRRSRRAAESPAAVDNPPALEKAALDHKVEMDGSEPRQSTILGSPSPRVVSMMSDRSATPGTAGSVDRMSELYGSKPIPRLHEDIMELPAESNQSVARKPVPERH